MRTASSVVFAALVLVGLAACSTAPQDLSHDRPAPLPATTSTPSPSDDALAAYRGMWTAFGVAARTADWRSPELARFVAGYARQQLVDSLQADEVQGAVTMGEFSVNPTVVSATPSGAPTLVRVADCGDDTGTTRVRKSDGEVLPGGQRGRHRIDAEVRRDGDGWKVDDFRLRAAGSC